MTALERVLAEIRAERQRQDDRWGEQNHPDVLPEDATDSRTTYAQGAQNWKAANALRLKRGHVAWDGILLEEVFEALAETDPARLREELIQVAAVAVNWVEAIDRRGR